MNGLWRALCILRLCSWQRKGVSQYVIKSAVTMLNQIFLRVSIMCPYSPHFSQVMGPSTENSLIVFKGSWTIHHVKTDQRMLNVYIVDGVTRFFDLELMEVWRRHDHNVSVNIGEQPISAVPLPDLKSLVVAMF
tara:strand:- start:646 stop:1047 length:402 start_codon:yes stop_codon:yes gene_type:complete